MCMLFMLVLSLTCRSFLCANANSVCFHLGWTWLNCSNRIILPFRPFYDSIWFFSLFHFGRYVRTMSSNKNSVSNWKFMRKYDSFNLVSLAFCTRLICIVVELASIVFKSNKLAWRRVENSSPTEKSAQTTAVAKMKINILRIFFYFITVFLIFSS